MQNQTATSGLKSIGAPIALNFSIPEDIATNPTATINLTDKYTANFKLNPPLIIPPDCCCDLIQSSFAYSQPNIAGPGEIESIPNGNNRISIRWGSAISYTDYYLPTGLYDYLDVQYQLNLIARNNGWATGSVDLFIVQGVSSTQKIVITINPLALSPTSFPVGGVDISLQNPSPVTGRNDSLCFILGFNPSYVLNIPAGGSTSIIIYAPNVAGFSDTSAYALYMSLIYGSYKDGLTGSLLYSFPLGNFSPNSIVSYQASLRYPVQISSGTFSNVKIWTTDQSGNRLPWNYYQAPFQFSVLISKNKADGSL